MTSGVFRLKQHQKAFRKYSENALLTREVKKTNKED